MDMRHSWQSEPDFLTVFGFGHTFASADVWLIICPMMQHALAHFHCSLQFRLREPGGFLAGLRNGFRNISEVDWGETVTHVKLWSKHLRTSGPCSCASICICAGHWWLFHCACRTWVCDALPGGGCGRSGGERQQEGKSSLTFSNSIKPFSLWWHQQHH